MKNSILLILGLSISIFSLSQEVKKTKDKNGFEYSYVENDPLKARIYTLKNGLTVYLSEYKDEPRIQTYVAVRAGSKTDPSDHTGLAHYLEHIMFKGTSKIGTSDWQKEKELLDLIEQKFEIYGAETDEGKRKMLYQEIDSISNIAATYAIANEYDKLVANIGASGTNAYTSFEQTVYVNNIPSNEIEKWVKIESERFSEVVPRLFHTELEAVYEEKNRALDSDQRKAWEAMMDGLFSKHPYGTQTTIGTIEHLKSPSITAIKKYFHKNYVANNMAICMSGDLNPDETIVLIDNYFSNYQSGTPDFQAFKAPVENTIEKPIIKNVVGPSAESVLIGFRLPGFSKRESFLMEVMSMTLANSEAGLIDLNLNQKQKVLGAYSYPMRLKDYSVHLLAASPKADQSLEEVKELLLSQVELIKKGDFDDWLLPAIVNDYRLSEIKAFESNKNRANAMVSAFIYGADWSDFILENSTLDKITKQEIIDFANKYYNNNYVVVNKKSGTDSETKKVEKPTISPVSVNRDSQSDFFKNITQAKTPSISPVFINFEKDLTFDKLTSDLPIHYKKNESNQLFNLYYLFEFGSDADLELDLAIDYLKYLGNDKYTAEELKKEFYKLGCSYSVFSSSNKVYVTLNGLDENFEKALKLFESFLKAPKANDQALKDMIDRILKGREDQKLSKKAILNSGMVNYAKYGNDSPFKHFLTEEELRKLSSDQLISKAKSLYNYQHKILYYGPKQLKDLKKDLFKYHRRTKNLLKPALVNREYKELNFDETEVYFVNYDMVQAEVVFLSKSVDFNIDMIPTTRVFNEYFGGSMGSIVFQELRESKALAYSVRSYYSTASEEGKSNYVISYIGAQNDKLFDAIDGMNQLLNEMPKSELLFKNAKDALKSELETNRTTKASVLFSYEQALKYGLDYDVKEKVYKEIDQISIQDINTFHQTYMANKKQKLLIIGNKDLVDLEGLKKYGKVTELSLEDIFGY